jgi:transcriptional regulator with XRE-family HTH domain
VGTSNPEDAPAAPSASAPLADKLSWLFDHIHPPGRGPYGFAEAARLIKARSGIRIAESYIGYLVKGKRHNPTLKHLRGLAALFGVPIGYLAGEPQDDEGPVSASVAQQLDLLHGLQNGRVKAIAQRSVGVSDKRLDWVLDFLSQVRELEGLPTDPPAQP